MVNILPVGRLFLHKQGGTSYPPLFINLQDGKAKDDIADKDDEEDNGAQAEESNRRPGNDDVELVCADVRCAKHPDTQRDKGRWREDQEDELQGPGVKA